MICYFTRSYWALYRFLRIPETCEKKTWPTLECQLGIPALCQFHVPTRAFGPMVFWLSHTTDTISSFSKMWWRQHFGGLLEALVEPCSSRNTRANSSSSQAFATQKPVNPGTVYKYYKSFQIYLKLTPQKQKKHSLGFVLNQKRLQALKKQAELYINCINMNASTAYK